MKKGRVILLVCLMMEMAILAGCKQEAQLTLVKQNVTRNDDFEASWKAEVVTYNGNTYFFQQGMYTTEEMKGYVLTMDQEMQEMDQYLKPADENRVTVYVMEEVPGGVTHADGKKVYCMAEDLDEDRYQGFLAMAHYHIGQPWIGFGIAGQIDDTERRDLTTYYSNQANMERLGLFGGDFYTIWVTKENYTASCETAIQLTAYLLQNQQGRKLLQDNVTVSDKQDWLKSIGVSLTYENPKDGETQGMTFTANNDFSLMIKSKQLSLYANQCSYLVNAEDAEELLHEYITAPQILTEAMKSVDNNPFREETHAIRIEAADQSTGNYMVEEDPDTGAWVYHLSKNNSKVTYWRLSLCLDADCNIENYHWYNMGFQYYLCLIQDKQGRFGEKLNNFWNLTGQNSEDVDSDETNLQDSYLKYKQAKGVPEDVTDLDMGYLIDLWASEKDSNSQDQSQIPLYQYLSLNASDRVDGDELNLYQSISFTNYIIEHYSMDQYINMTFWGQGAKQAIGISYDELVKQWKEYLEKLSKGK